MPLVVRASRIVKHSLSSTYFLIVGDRMVVRKGKFEYGSEKGLFFLHRNSLAHADTIIIHTVCERTLLGFLRRVIIILRDGKIQRMKQTALRQDGRESGRGSEDLEMLMLHRKER